MRVRFAPSPTGFLHIGNVRTAINNFIIAKKYKAEMILRIEDTDMERSSKESELFIMEDLKWLGIDWAEGPDIKGAYGPYRQSERFGIYKEFTEKLLAERKAYHCYCTPSELDLTRKKAAEANEQIVYSGKCRNLKGDEKKKFESEGRSPSVRFKVPDGETIVINDLVKGRVVFDSENIGGDFIIVRSDGAPVYNYIVVIDDSLMKITHVVRGEDHLSNTPKQILVAKALGMTIPEYAHHGLVLGPDRSKLSKRHGITSLRSYREMGYLPEALMNYLALLGWASESGGEILTIEKIAEEIDFNKLPNSPAVFDFQKLKWMNGVYIRDFPLGNIINLFVPFIKEAGYLLEGIDPGWLREVISIVRVKCELLSDIKNLIGIFLEDIIPPDEETDRLLSEEGSLRVIDSAHKFINSVNFSEKNFYNELLNYIKETTSLKGKNLFMPIRGIITGRLKGPELDISVPVIGIEKCKKRISYMQEKYIKNA